jgi:hypothetical protein
MQRKIILPVVLYLCETSSLTLREEQKLKVCMDWMLTKFGPKRDEIIRDWRKLYNEELHNMYSSPNVIKMIKSRRMRYAENVSCVGEKTNA